MPGGRRERSLEAAVAVLGAEGARGLTHRAVDAAAGLPAGSTSNYFRTRQSLVEAIIEHLAAAERRDWEALAGQVDPGNVDELARLLAGYAAYATGPARARTVARLALFLEAAVRPGLRVALARSRAAILAWGAQWLRRLGAENPEPACRTVLDHLDGLILHELAFPDPQFDPGPAIRRVLASLLRSGGRA